MVVCVLRENLTQWEMIARGEVEDVAQKSSEREDGEAPPASSPVKVDN